jgi:hypothetical protein
MHNLRSAKRKKFQILFLRNDSTQEVEVHEVKEVDFPTIQEHLEHGDSIFITTKNSQKLNLPECKNKVTVPLKTRVVTSLNFTPL